MTNKPTKPKRPYYPVDPWDDMRAPRRLQHGTPPAPDYSLKDEEDLIDDPVQELTAPIIPKHIRKKNMPEIHRRRRVVAISAVVGAALLTALIASHESKADAEINQEALNELNNQVPIEQVVPIQPEAPLPGVDIENLEPTVESVERATAVNIELLPATASQIENRMPLIEELKPLYMQAAEEVGLPWQAAAALHYREADNRVNRSMLSGELLGTVNPDSNEVAPTDQFENYVKALEHLKTMAKNVYGIELTSSSSFEDFAKAATAFNRGYKYDRAGMTYLDLPYAMAGLEGFEGMRWPTLGGSYADGNTYGETSTLAGKTESRPGFVAIMAGLGYDASNQSIASR